jgi:hypothetical protein
MLRMSLVPFFWPDFVLRSQMSEAPRQYTAGDRKQNLWKFDTANRRLASDSKSMTCTIRLSRLVT